MFGQPDPRSRSGSAQRQRADAEGAYRPEACRRVFGRNRIRAAGAVQPRGSGPTRRARIARATAATRPTSWTRSTLARPSAPGPRRIPRRCGTPPRTGRTRAAALGRSAPEVAQAERAGQQSCLLLGAHRGHDQVGVEEAQAGVDDDLVDAAGTSLLDARREVLAQDGDRIAVNGQLSDLADGRAGHEAQDHGGTVLGGEIEISVECRSPVGSTTAAPAVRQARTTRGSYASTEVAMLARQLRDDRHQRRGLVGSTDPRRPRGRGLRPEVDQPGTLGSQDRGRDGRPTLRRRRSCPGRWSRATG